MSDKLPKDFEVTKGAAPISEKIMSILEETLPPFFRRDDAAKYLQGIFTYQTLANFTKDGGGPPIHYMGRKVYYVKEEFLPWLREYFRTMEVEYDGYMRRVRRTDNVDQTEASDGESS